MLLILLKRLSKIICFLSSQLSVRACGAVETTTIDRFKKDFFLFSFSAFALKCSFQKTFSFMLLSLLNLFQMFPKVLSVAAKSD